MATLAKKIKFDKGMKVDKEPAGRRTVIGVPFASILIALSKDSTAELTMPWDEAVALGYIKED